MKSKLKTIIIVLIILILLVALITIWIIQNNEKQNSIVKNADEFEYVPEEEEDNSVTSNYEYINVVKMAQYYIDYINDNNYDAVITVLDKDYATTNNITKEKLQNSLTETIGNRLFVTKMTKKAFANENIVYFINGILTDNETGKYSDTELTVIVNVAEKAYSIIPKNLENEKDYKFNFNTIKYDSNDYYNELMDDTVAESEIVQEQFEYYRALTICNSKEAFEKLDQEYKTKRFNNDLNQYVEYLKTAKMNQVVLKQYTFNFYPDYTEYIFTDTLGNYYILRQKQIMDIAFILDTYTLDLKEFAEKYNESTTKNKTALNIEKVKEALNSKDYSYVYSKLDSTFKANNYNSLEKFAEYMQSNLFERNNFEYTSAEEQQDLYVYKVKISDAYGATTETKSMTIIMRLDEGIGFTMSFSME